MVVKMKKLLLLLLPVALFCEHIYDTKLTQEIIKLWIIRR